MGDGHERRRLPPGRTVLLGPDSAEVAEAVGFEGTAGHLRFDGHSGKVEFSRH